MELPKEFLVDGSMKTFDNQDNLPSLPIPTLEKTLEKYLESVRPQLTDAEFRQTQFVVQQFASGQGRELQKKFVEQCGNQRNWLEKLWEKKAYLEGRYPTAPLVNIAGPGPYYHTVFPPKEGTQLERAGIVIYTSCLFWDILLKEKLKIDPAGKTALSCMHQYKHLYNACKIPGIKQDTINFHFKTEREGRCPHHVVVLCRRRFFKLDVLHESGDYLTPPELESQLRFIQQTCEKSDPAPGLGALTGDNRTRWAENRAYLLELHPSHAESLKTIETSLFTFALDDNSPADFHEVALSGLIGDPKMRWFDKSLTQIVFKNGTVISNLDHAPFDGIVYIYATYFCNICIETAGGKWLGNRTIRKLPPPKEIVFHYDKKICDAIETAEKCFRTNGDNIECRVPIYTGYGKRIIRKYKLHPDAYVQMALQLAYYRMYHKPAPTYETATTRQFWHGRTETLRSCTQESLAWTQAMLDEHVEPSKKLRLLHAALGKHVQNMIECCDMKGCDRHLLALSVLAEESGIPKPAIFTDPAYQKSGGNGNFIISTSFVGYTPVLGGCAPMCENGYGCFYSIQQNTISFYITTWVSDNDTSAQDLFHNLSLSLLDMRNLIESETPRLNKL